MKLYGLQKMTLLDFPGRVACTVFLSGCDFRCPYCHNYELACGSAPAVMEEEEFFAFLKKRTGLLDGVAITGGEPCLHRDLPSFMERIHQLGFAVKLDTNGYHPGLLEEILEAGLADYVAMDIKNSAGKYAQTCGVKSVDMDRIYESIRLIMDKAAAYEFRTTVVKELHEAEDFEEIGRMISGAERYFLQSFTDRDTVPFDGLHAHETAKLEEFAAIMRASVHCCALRGTD